MKPESPEELPEVVVPDLDRCVQTAIYEKTFSAAACIASVGGRIYHRAVYGCPTTPPPVRRLGHDTLFDLASLTKPLGTGLAALQLSSQNRLDLNASVGKTIPELKDSRFQDVTIDMLLEHTSGLPAVRSFWQELVEDEAGKPAAQRVAGTARAVPLMRQRFAQVLLEYEPGSKVLYSDLGFMALGWIIESIVGKPLDVYLAREVYRPLGLDNDLFFVRLDDLKGRQRLARRLFAATEDCPWRQRVLQGEVHDPNSWALGGVAGHAGLFGTADAVWRLVRALWEAYKGEGRAFLGGSVRRFWTRSKRLRDTTRTLAWDTPSAHGSAAGKRFSLNSVGHLGFTGCSVWVDLNSDIIGVLLANSAHPTPDGKQEKMAKLRPRVYELIAKHGESLPADPERPKGAAAFYSGPIGGASLPLASPLKTPGRY